jgi:hypothetical protein
MVDQSLLKFLDSECLGREGAWYVTWQMEGAKVYVLMCMIVTEV